MTQMRYVEIWPGMHVVGCDGYPLGTLGAIHLPSVVEQGQFRPAERVDAIVPVSGRPPPPPIAGQLQGPPVNAGAPVSFGPSDGYVRVDRPEPLAPTVLYVPLKDVSWVSVDTIVLRGTEADIQAHTWHVRPPGIVD